MRNRELLIGTCVLALVATAEAGDIVRCGQPVERGETAVLQVDLDCTTALGTCVGDPTLPCTGTSDPSCPQLVDGADLSRFCEHSWVVLPSGATLELNGHRLIGQKADLGGGVGGHSGVTCTGRRCTVNGPGQIDDFLGCGVHGYYTRVAVQNVTFDNNGCGIGGNAPIRLNAEDVTITGSELYGIGSAKTVRGRNVTTSGNGADGLTASTVKIDGLTATGNGFGPSAGFGGAGVWAGRMSLANATITGNNGYDQGLDVMAAKRPRFENVICGRSALFVDHVGPPWAVCAND